MAQTTLDQRKLSVSSAVVISLFLSMSKRAGDFRCVRQKRRPVHGTAMFARKSTTIMPTWSITQYFHRLQVQATPIMKNHVRRNRNNSPKRRLEHHRILQEIRQALVKGKFIFRQALMEEDTAEKSIIQEKACSLRTRRNENSTRWYCASLVQHF